jgi:hypothetical protein
VALPRAALYRVRLAEIAEWTIASTRFEVARAERLNASRV